MTRVRGLGADLQPDIRFGFPKAGNGGGSALTKNVHIRLSGRDYAALLRAGLREGGKPAGTIGREILLEGLKRRA